MPPRSRGLVWTTLIAMLPVVVAPAAAQSGRTVGMCSVYQTAVRGGATGAVPTIAKDLLVNIDVALPCLVPLLENLDKRPDRPSFRSAERAQFLSVTGAMRTMISGAIASDEIASDAHDAAMEKFKAGGSIGEEPQLPPGRLRAFIEKFRGLDNTRVASVLMHALRDEERVFRANALLILANVVDNRTVCVAMDHLYDSDLLAQSHGRMARANLLAVVSIVAPWAYRDTYRNIEQVLIHTEPQVDRSDPSLDYTRRAIRNIRERLGRQRPDSNKAVCLPKDERDCYAYVAEKASKAQLRYPAPNCPPPD